MGNNCYGCGKKTDVVTERDSNGTADKNASLKGVQAKSLLAGKIGVEDNDNTTSKNRRMSEETIWFDAMDRFPSSDGMLYPPTDSMRQLPMEFDMKRHESLRLLLNSSFQASTASRIGETLPSPSLKETRASVALVSEHLSVGNECTQGRGYPGELTEDELETCLKFREELKKRDPAFKEMVMAMHPYEEEAFALCRFLRARDFDAEGVFSMMQEKNQTENWNAVKSQDPNFFKEFHRTIPEFNGCPLPVFLTQFPCMEAGIGKNGAIIVYFKAGKVSCPGVECIVGDLVNALPFAWNRLYNGGRDAMKREIARSDTANTTVLAEKIIVVDLEGDSSLFTSGLSFLRVSPTAGACFPENVNRTYILNAPFSFSIAWAGIRQMLDPRTVKKVGFFTTIAKANTDFLEHIESDELLSCYGGTGQSFDDMIADRQREYTHKEGVIRYVVELLYMSGRPVGFDFDLTDNEKVDSIVVYSRSDNMCEISVVDGKSNDFIGFRNVSRENATSKVSFSPDTPENALAHNNYAVEIASSEDFDNGVKGPFSVKTKGGTRGDYFLVAISVAEK